MRRLATTLAALGFLWTCGATVYVLVASSEAGAATTAMLAGGSGATRVPLALETSNGVWMTGVLLGLTMLAGIPVGVALGHPPGLRPMAWTAGVVLLGFCTVAGSLMGLLYLPSALLLVLAGALSRAERDATGIANVPG